MQNKYAHRADGPGGPAGAVGTVGIEGDVGCRRDGQVVASIRCSLFRVGSLSRKPLSPMHRSTFLPL